MSTPSLRSLPNPGETPAPPEMPALAHARQGYHPGQVHQYVSALLDRIRELERGFAHQAERGATVAIHEAESPEGRELLADLMKLAVEEITGQKAAAAAEAAQLLQRASHDAESKLSGAAAQAHSIVAAAEQEAQKLVAGARTQSDTALATARAQAKQIVDQASVHAAAVDEGAQRRLDSMRDLHEETCRRLAEIHEVTGGVLATDRQRGSLQDEVTRATAALAGSSDAPAPLPVPERGELPPAEPPASEQA